MRLVAASEVHRLLDFPALIERLREAFRVGADVPLRQHHRIPVPGDPDATLLLMPAWRAGKALGVKLVAVFPGNKQRNLPTVTGQYLLLDARTGIPCALIDGTALTAWRTAAASALAASYLAREDALHFLMVGAGALAPYLIAAHCAARPIRRVAIWARRPDRATALAAATRIANVAAEPVTDLRAAIAAAEIICCATLAREPLVLGAWLKPGQHLDLVGGFTPAMREADDGAVRRARVFVDTRTGALVEAGDIVQPIANRILKTEEVADLFDLCRRTVPGRTNAAEVTLFKSVGTALEDLAAAELVAERMGV